MGATPSHRTDRAPRQSGDLTPAAPLPQGTSAPMSGTVSDVTSPRSDTAPSRPAARDGATPLRPTLPAQPEAIHKEEGLRTLPELLSPAGGPDAFRAALAARADAIYCGMGSFNARRKADNFDDNTFEEACRLAHLAGARVYVTVNIVIKQTEMTDALDLVRRCAQLGADAFIIQDWGLFFQIRSLMPELELHVSTQANIHDARGVTWCQAAGAERVTLSRELSIAEIAQIHRAAGGDLEVFAHGSICFSYSGVCLLSSFACRGRSANRGMCAQPCRLPYELVDEKGHRLSAPGRDRALCPRDTNTIDLIDDLIAAGAGALKLEGRMKAPEYVYAITDAYRRALDARGGALDADERGDIMRQLKRCFNRDFTSAYQQGTSGDEMMSYERSNNRGQEVGRTVGFTPRRTRTKGQAMRDAARGAKGMAAIELTDAVGAGDLLELRHDDDPDQFLTGLVRADAAAGDTIEVEVARPMPTGCRVRLIRSQRALDVADAAIRRPWPRKRAVTVRVRARIGEPFTVEVACVDQPDIVARAAGFIVEAARTKPVTEADLVEHVGRMGTSPFEPVSFDVNLDEGAGMGFSAVHRVRADACAALEEAILAPWCDRADRLAQVELNPEPAGADPLPNHPDGPNDPPGAPWANTAPSVDAPTASTEAGSISASRIATVANAAPEPVLCALAASLEAADAAREAGATRIYVPADALDVAGFTPDEAAARGLIPVLDEVCRERDHARLDRWVRPGAPVAVGNISHLALAYDKGALAEVRSCIPVHNSACAHALAAHGGAAIWLSPELSLDEIVQLSSAAPVPTGITVFGAPRVMTSEHCILQVADACIHDCARCGLRQRKLFLRNIDRKLLPVRTDAHGRSRLYAAAPLDLAPQLPQLVAAGVTRFLVDGTLLDARELAQQVRRMRRALAAAAAGQTPLPRQAGASSGCLFVGVE